MWPTRNFGRPTIALDLITLHTMNKSKNCSSSINFKVVHFFDITFIIKVFIKKFMKHFMKAGFKNIEID